MKIENTKQELKRTLLECANISRIHIVGCQRSGTTMLHYSMSERNPSIVNNDFLQKYPNIHLGRNKELRPKELNLDYLYDLAGIER